VWAFPDGATGAGAGEGEGEAESEVVTVYNPTGEVAEVDVEVALDPSPDPAQPIAVEPFQLSIAPLDFAQVDDRCTRRYLVAEIGELIVFVDDTGELDVRDVITVVNRGLKLLTH